MINIKTDFDKIKIKYYQCENGIRFFDDIRNCFLCITPEETVRQKMVQFLIAKMNVPKKNIYVEDHLAHYGIEDINGRIDISLVTDEKTPLAVIECKAESIDISAMQVYEQAVKYAGAIGAPYVILVNGINVQFFHLDSKTNTYKNINGVLSYKEMIDNKYDETVNNDVFMRLDYEDYFNLDFLRSKEWYEEKIGIDTYEELVPFIINLDDCLLDCSHKMLTTTVDYLEVIDDLGIQYRNYSDASGGGFGSGYYRVLLINDKRISKYFLIGFTIVTTGKMINDPVYGTSDGKSVLVIFRNDGDADEMSVQVNMNKFVTLNSKVAEISHNGVVTRKGAKKSDVLQYISSKAMYLVDNDRIVFGKIDFSKNLYMDSADIVNCLTRMIEYSIYRDEYKKCIKKK